MALRYYLIFAQTGIKNKCGLKYEWLVSSIRFLFLTIFLISNNRLGLVTCTSIVQVHFIINKNLFTQRHKIDNKGETS